MKKWRLVVYRYIQFYFRNGEYSNSISEEYQIKLLYL